MACIVTHLYTCIIRNTPDLFGDVVPRFWHPEIVPAILVDQPKSSVILEGTVLSEKQS